MLTDPRLATRTRHMQSNAIREILKVVSKPGMISLAGGIPAPESFPTERMDEIFGTVMAKYGAQALQYDATEGFEPLRVALSDYLAQQSVQASAEEILIFSGSQSVLDTVAKMVISPGDIIVTEEPTYLGALSAFAPYEPRYRTVSTDEEGMIPEALEEVLKTEAVKLIYLTPTFQNPTGYTLSLARRRAIGQLLQTYNCLLLEDDPYSALRYRGHALPPVWSFAPEQVIYSSTLSKVFAPGLRIGFCVAPEWLRPWLVVAKQGVDLHTSTLNQALAVEYLTGGHLPEQLATIIELYRPRQEALLQALTQHFPQDFIWSRPEGGMFVWVIGPEGLDAEAVYWSSVEKGTAFVPGKYFFAQPETGLSTMRLNFTMVDESTLDHAVQVIAEAIQEATAETA
ncbi:MAG: PLP-dependent aminotransferase family protein [Chloroflexota bacterium]